MKFWIFAILDDLSLADAARLASTTIATFTEATTEDDDENDDDKPMLEHEKKDETNDGEKMRKFPTQQKRRNS